MSAAAIVAENYHLKWGSHSMHMNMSVANLYKHDRFADVMLLSSHPNCLGGPGVPAHKIILSASSKFFATVFELTPHIPSQNGLMYLVLPPALSRRAIQVLVQYMYSGESTVSNDILNEVLDGGELLKIRGLYRGKSNDSTKSLGLAPPVKPVSEAQVMSSTNYPRECCASPSPSFKSIERNTSNIKQYSRATQRRKSVTDTILDKQFNLSVNKEIAIDPEHRNNATNSPKFDNINSGKSKQKLETPLIVSVTSNNSSQSSIERRKPSVGSNYSDCLLQIKEEPNDSDSERSQPISKNLIEILDSGSKIEDTEIQTIETCLVDESSKDDITSGNCDMELQNIMVSDEENSASFFSDYCDEKIAPPNEMPKNSKTKQISVSVDNILEKKRKIEKETVGNKKNSLSNNNQKKSEELKSGLKCDICNISFQFPGSWVRHMQSFHTEAELAINNGKLEKLEKVRMQRSQSVANCYLDKLSKSCAYCDMLFNSYKEMVTHMKKEHLQKCPS